MRLGGARETCLLHVHMSVLSLSNPEYGLGGVSTVHRTSRGYGEVGKTPQRPVLCTGELEKHLGTRFQWHVLLFLAVRPSWTQLFTPKTV